MPLLLIFVAVQGDGDSFLREVILSIQDESAVFMEWFTFGLHLGLDVNELQSLEVMSLKTVDPRYGIRGVLATWRKKFPQAGTWEPIIEALKRIDAVRLGQQLEEQHRQPYLTSTPV